VAENEIVERRQQLTRAERTQIAEEAAAIAIKKVVEIMRAELKTATKTSAQAALNDTVNTIKIQLFDRGVSILWKVAIAIGLIAFTLTEFKTQIITWFTGK